MRVCEPAPTPSVHCPGCELAAAGYCSEAGFEPIAVGSVADVVVAGSENELGSGPGTCEAAEAAAAMEIVDGTGLGLETSEAGLEAYSESSEPVSQPVEAVGPVAMVGTASRRR